MTPITDARAPHDPRHLDPGAGADPLATFPTALVTDEPPAPRLVARPVAAARELAAFPAGVLHRPGLPPWQAGRPR